MCSVCGCGHGDVRIDGLLGKAHEHGNAPGPHAHTHAAHAAGSHQHSHHHAAGGHTHPHGEHVFGADRAEAEGGSATGALTDPTRLIAIEKSILSKNQGFADGNRASWSRWNLLSLNLVSSPGAGKTSLLIKTLEALREDIPLWVIEGDQETSNDAEKIRRTGVPAVQINTGRGCHLDAHMVGHAADELELVENGASRIERITIRLGVLCGIARSLYFCFKPAARGTACESTVLTIIEVPLRVLCKSCNDTKTPRALYNFRCPDCGQPTPDVLTGREMELVSIEISPGAIVGPLPAQGRRQGLQ